MSIICNFHIHCIEENGVYHISIYEEPAFMNSWGCHTPAPYYGPSPGHNPSGEFLWIVFSLFYIIELGISFETNAAKMEFEYGNVIISTMTFLQIS